MTQVSLEVFNAALLSMPNRFRRDDFGMSRMTLAYYPTCMFEQHKRYVAKEHRNPTEYFLDMDYFKQPDSQ